MEAIYHKRLGGKNENKIEVFDDAMRTLLSN